MQDHPVYAAMIQEMDEAVSTVLTTLEEQDLVDDTLVVFTSDNGGLSTAEGSPTSNLPLRAGKGYLYEGGIRVPLIVRWPGVVPPGSRCDVPVTTLDVAATLLDAGAAARRHEPAAAALGNGGASASGSRLALPALFQPGRAAGGGARGG